MTKKSNAAEYLDGLLETTRENAEPVHYEDHATYCSEYECFCDVYVNPYREETE